MFQLQPDRNNIFRRTWNNLQTNNHSQASEDRIIFEACKLTIQSMLQVLFYTQAWKLQQIDLSDYDEALLEIRICFHNFSVSNLGTRYPFNNIIYPLEQATIYLGGALGIKNSHATTRIGHILDFRSWLVKTLEQIEGLEDIPP